MGADFIGFAPTDLSRGMGYHTVHRFRWYLVEMCVAGKVKDVSEFKRIEADDDRFKGLMSELNELYNLTGEDKYLGTIMFADHSDCDGIFGNDCCGCIATAFESLLDTSVITDEMDREVIISLAKVFRDSYEKGGIVVVW